MGRLAHTFWQCSKLTALCHTWLSKYAGHLILCACYFHILLWITLEMEVITLGIKWLLKSVWVAKIDQKFILLHSWHSLISKVFGHLFITLVYYHLPYQQSWMVATWDLRSYSRICCWLSRLHLYSSWQWLLNTNFASLLLSFVSVISFHCARDFFLADGFLHISVIFLFYLLFLIAVPQISVQLCRYQA